MAPAACSTLPSAWGVWTSFSGEGVGAGTLPGSGGSTDILAGGIGGTGETGDIGMAAGTPQFVEPTGR